MRIKRIAAIAAVSVAAVAGSTAPASAHPQVAVFTGTATTSGTWAPASPFCPGTAPCPAANTWSFSSSTDVVLLAGVSVTTTTPPFVTVTATGSGRVSGSGSFTGWCGRSTGSGSATVNGDTGSVSWQSAGTIIVLTGSGPGHPVAAAVVAARAAAGTGNCVTGAATNFDVVGVAAIVGV